MADVIQTVVLNDRIKNDTFESINFIFSDGVPNPIDITTWIFRLQFRLKSKTGKIMKDVSVGTGLTITDGPNGVLRLDTFELDWPAATYYYDINANTGTKKKTYIQGTMEVVQDTTYD